MVVAGHYFRILSNIKTWNYGLVRQTAIEFARPSKKLGIPHKIRINAVSPTFTTCFNKRNVKF